MIVYLVRCEVNERCYVGKTIRTLAERWNEHCRDARNNRKTGDLYADIRRYGREAFTCEMLGETNLSRRLAQMERKFIRYYNAVEAGYNQAVASFGGKPRVRTLRTYAPTDEQRRKIANSVRLSWINRRKKAEVAA